MASRDMGLPEKALLAIDQVVDRWKYWECDYATLLGYAQQDLLIFSVYLRELGSHRTFQQNGEDMITREVQTIQFRSPNAVVRRLFHLDADDARRILEAKPNEEVAVHSLYWSTARMKKQATYHVPAKYFTLQDLMVTRAECERFERQYKATGIRGLIKRVGYWIKEPSPSSLVHKIGGALVIVATGVWAVFKWYAS